MKVAFLPLHRALSRRIKRSFPGTMFSAFRPERHYMRGSEAEKQRAQYAASDAIPARMSRDRQFTGATAELSMAERPEGHAAGVSRRPRLVARGHRLFAALWRKLTTLLANSYRPERHYMRGPGPKWHERNSENLESEGSGATARQQLGVMNG